MRGSSTNDVACTSCVSNISFGRAALCTARAVPTEKNEGCRVNMPGKSDSSTNILRGKYIIRSSCISAKKDARCLLQVFLNIVNLRKEKRILQSVVVVSSCPIIITVSPESSIYSITV